MEYCRNLSSLGNCIFVKIRRVAHRGGSRTPGTSASSRQDACASARRRVSRPFGGATLSVKQGAMLGRLSLCIGLVLGLILGGCEGSGPAPQVEPQPAPTAISEAA